MSYYDPKPRYLIPRENPLDRQKTIRRIQQLGFEFCPLGIYVDLPDTDPHQYEQWRVRHSAVFGVAAYTKVEIAVAASVPAFAREFLITARPWQLDLPAEVMGVLEFYDLLEGGRNSLNRSGFRAQGVCRFDHATYLDTEYCSDEFYRPFFRLCSELWGTMSPDDVAAYNAWREQFSAKPLTEEQLERQRFNREYRKALENVEARESMALALKRQAKRDARWESAFA